MVEKKSGVLKNTLFVSVSEHSEILCKSQVSVDSMGDYDIPTENAQRK